MGDMRLKYPILNTHYFKSLAKFALNPSLYLLPRFVRDLADPERTLVDKFIFNLESVSKGELLLDAGAGSFRYKETLLQKGYRYESQDFEDVFDKSSQGLHTFICDIQNIPVKSQRYDAIICTQVLEHVTNPENVFKELSRILKPEGRIYLTTNFIFPIHGAPYDFYRFTNYGLDYLAKVSGLTEIQITSRGGFFSLCAKLVFDLPAILKSWLFYGSTNLHGQRNISLKNPFLIVIMLPSVFLLDVFCTILASVINLFDPLDKRKRFTLGYQLSAKGR
jgi:SAM-dependent methyltransferase